MASRREEQRKRDQSLALSFSESVSRKDFRVRMVASLCSFLKCRTLFCLIYENERLSLLVFIKRWIQCSVFVWPQVLSVAKLGTSLIQFLKQKFLRLPEIECPVISQSVPLHAMPGTTLCKIWWSASGGEAVWESLWAGCQLLWAQGCSVCPWSLGKSWAVHAHSGSTARAEQTVCDENTCASWQSHSLLPIPCSEPCLCMDTKLQHSGHCPGGVSCVYRAGKCWGMNPSSCSGAQWLLLTPHSLFLVSIPVLLSLFCQQRLLDCPAPLSGAFWVLCVWEFWFWAVTHKYQGCVHLHRCCLEHKVEFCL